MLNENSKAIYLQIADRICDDILAGRLDEECRLPSVREYAALVQVNPNTVMRTYDQLAQEGIIFNRRGIGFFVSAGARQDILRRRAAQFLDHDIYDVFRRLSLIGVGPEDLAARYTAWLEENSDNNI